MLETNDDATLEKRQVEEVSSREREKGQPVDESEVDEVALIKEANESEASERNEEPDEKIAYFLRGKGLSENLVKTLINADLTDEYVRSAEIDELYLKSFNTYLYIYLIYR